MKEVLVLWIFKKRKLYSKLQILRLNERQTDVCWAESFAENTQTCCLMCLHYCADPLWEMHRAPDRGRRWREGLTVREVVVGRDATKVKGVCDYVGMSHLPLSRRARTRTRTHTHRFAQIVLLGLHIDFHSLVQPSPNPYPNPKLNLTPIHTLPVN